MSGNSIIKPKRPVGAGWIRMQDPPAAVTLGYAGESWYHHDSRIFVITEVEVANDGDGVNKGPEYHISISRTGANGYPSRCTTADALWTVQQFGLDGAEEDNHVPNGVVRNFWRPVAENLVGIECKCKADEPAIVEDKGDFVWRGVTHRGA